MQNIVILGAGYAGMMAALRLSHTTRKRKDVKVILINGAEHFVERIRLHEVAAGHPPKSHAIESLLRGTGIQFIHAWVSEIQADKHVVMLETADGKQSIHYDKLVYTLGSIASKDMIPGAEDYAFNLNSNSATALQSHLKTLNDGGRVVIIGAGLTGIESATEIAESYPNLRVTMMTSGKLGENLSEKGQDYLHKTFAEMNIELIEDARVNAIEKNQLIMADGHSEFADAVLCTAGFIVPELAKQSGFAVDKSGRIIVDAYLRSQSHPDVYAAGDAMNFEERVPLDNRMSCQSAMPIGAQVGNNLAAWVLGKEEEAFAFGYAVQCIGLGQNRGLVQMIHPDDRMKEQIITGAMGSFIKKTILKGTLWSILLERRFPAYTMWLKSISLQEKSTKRLIAEH